ncbi:MAG: 2Fe-2S iron-sulfur cluster-binding protein [Casimicrobiaceae bacterium]
MPKVTFIAFNGTHHAVDVPVGTTLMRAAVDNNVPGIDGDCGGQCACATCHVFVDPAWTAATGERTQVEEDMLNFAAELRENSRLACQIELTDALDGLVVAMPEGQH